MRISIVALALALVAALAATPQARAADAVAERLYIFDCGQSVAKDQSRWSPGVNVGVPIEFADNCYLIRHARGALLWDTGFPDSYTARPEGVVGMGGQSVARRTKTLADQLAALGVTPLDITYVAISHTHGDHVGNLDQFPDSTLLFQRAEFDWAFADKPKPFPDGQPVKLLDGDFDVFGDGSVVVVSTPGHTPGHQSLMVRLAKTGVVLLSGDAVHFMANWENRRVPAINFDRAQTLASMQRLADLVARHNGRLWINHDKPQSDGLAKSPAFHE
jgi:glyoxylase-like metal-dependent hydrolase (beta-lactamase superfamily II)